MQQLKQAILITLGLVLVMPQYSRAQYKDFVRKENRVRLFEVAFDKKRLIISVFTNAEVKSVTVNRAEIALTDTVVRIDPNTSFALSELRFNGTTVLYSDITDAIVTAEKNLTTITFYSSDQPTSRTDKVRAGNIVTFSDSITVEAGDFVRGLIFSVKGPVTVSGEVNKDIISLFGNITLITDAVARGHLVSVTGEIKVEQHASLYGEIYSGMKEYDSRRFRFYRSNEFAFSGMLNYNRVDGLLLGGELSFADADSTLPAAEIGLGYGLESNRLRYFARLTQTIARKSALAIGAEVYKRLDSEDDWLLSNAENAVFVLLATEDFKDYYETEGIAGWIYIDPVQNLNVKTGFRYDDTRWLRAHRQMWSLFGGSKIFRENFSSVEPPFRDSGISEINSSETGFIFLNAEYDSRNPAIDSNYSWLTLTGELEWSNDDLASDHEYRRYSLTAIRYQYFNNRASLRLRGKFANSDGYLPMYKRYFIGGLGTLQGYEHKEFIGTRYWMANSEFWFKIFRSKGVNLIGAWDVAQIANDAKLDANAEILHDLGIGVGIASFRVDLTKRLDSADDRDPRIVVRFATRF